LKILPEKKLQCTKTGQVNSSYPDEVDVQQHNEYMADTLKKTRQEFRQNTSHSAYLSQIRRSISLPKHQMHGVKPEQMGTVGDGNYTLHKVILRRKGQPPMPCLILLPPSNEKIQKTVVWFPEKGKASIADSTSLINRYGQDHDAVILADMRGMGEMKDPAQFNGSKYHNHEYRNAAISLHIGRPLVGQRTQDVRTVMDYVKKKNRLKNKPVEINATGTAAPAALYAAVFDPKISHLNLYHTIKSYNYIVRHPLMKDAFSYVVPDVLKYYDLPDLVKLVGPKKVTYINSI